MTWDLPVEVEIDGQKHKIRNMCDYRVVLDIISVFKDSELSQEEKIKCALFIFYENLSEISNIKEAIDQMMLIVNTGDEHEESDEKKPVVMDWVHDFPQLAPPISRVLGYSVRDSRQWTHWYDFVGAYMEIGDCTFSNIVSIRQKIQKGKQLDNWEQDFYRNNKKLIDLPHALTDEEKEWLDSD